MNELVLVTEKEFYKAEAIFRNAPHDQFEPAVAEEQQLAEMVRSRSVRAVVVGIQPYVGPLYETLAAVGGERGALIARFGVGLDSIDKSQARRYGVVVTNTPSVLDVSVAEHAMWLLGNLAKHIGLLESQFRAGQFVPKMGVELRGKVLAVIGFGAIGRRVAAMAHFGFGMEVRAVDVYSPQELEKQEQCPLAQILAAHGAAQYTNDIESVLRRADVVSIHLPLTPKTRQIFDARRLSLMKPTAMLVNTARGPVLDEIALFEALSNSQLAGAALDVFENEPYRPAAPGKDLRTLENVVLTPHVSSNTREANDRMAHACLENVTKFFAGRIGELSRVDLT
jgi:lactate dehydrogenase-like 2-hydroxyacid dehydrogenase